MTYPSFNVFKGCMEAIFAIEELRDKHFSEAIEPYVNGHSVPTLGDNIIDGLVRMLIEEFNDTEGELLKWWLYETNIGVSSKGWKDVAVVTIKGEEVKLYNLETLYKLLTGGFDE